MNQQTFDIVMGYVRHALTGAGGAMIAHGAITSNDATAIIGGVMAVLGVIWSHYNKTAK